MPGKTLRLDRYIASVTDFSRSEVKRLIKDGLVEVDGAVVLDPASHLGADSVVELEECELRRPDYRYFMLNKPTGYVSAARDRRHPTVMDLVYEDNADRLHLAGRLDIDATGLVLVTDDGQWAHAVMSPRRRCWKRYRVQTADPIPPGAVDRFASGIFIESEKYRTRPAELSLLEERLALLRITEGRFHQVKRMFAALGNEVIALHREAVGGIELDIDLEPGDYRALTEAEVASVLR